MLQKNANMQKDTRTQNYIEKPQKDTERRITSILEKKKLYIDSMTGKFFPYKKEGKIICRAYLDIRAQYGTSLKEKAYHKLMKEWFEAHKIPYIYEPSLQIRSQTTNKVIDYYKPDFLVFEKIPIETKATRMTIKQDIDQLYNYLRNSKYEVGYLFNFGTSKRYIRRIIYTNDRKPHLKTQRNIEIPQR